MDRVGHPNNEQHDGYHAIDNGDFLPDQEKPQSGVFLIPDQEETMALRYDLTAPLARYVAQNYDNLPKPFRRYQLGKVWRNEKPGPERFREFYQFDADTIGSSSVFADGEMCILLNTILKKLWGKLCIIIYFLLERLL